MLNKFNSISNNNKQTNVANFNLSVQLLAGELLLLSNLLLLQCLIYFLPSADSRAQSSSSMAATARAEKAATTATCQLGFLFRSLFWSASFQQLTATVAVADSLRISLR